MQPPPKKPRLAELIRVFIVPTLIGKSFVLYFGIHYSAHPDEGYGYGLLLSIIFTVATLSLFMWRYRNIEDI